MIEPYVENDRWRVECEGIQYKGTSISIKIRIIDLKTKEVVLEKKYSANVTGLKSLLEEIKNDVVDCQKSH